MIPSVACEWRLPAATERGRVWYLGPRLWVIAFLLLSLKDQTTFYNLEIVWIHDSGVGNRVEMLVVGCGWMGDIWVRPRRCGCLVTWFCYHLIAKPGNKTAATAWPDQSNFVAFAWATRRVRSKGLPACNLIIYISLVPNNAQNIPCVCLM